MNFIIFTLFIMILVFACVALRLSDRLGDANSRITLLEIKTNYLEQSEKATRDSVNLQTKCIRDLNDIVKKSVENKEPTEPDAKALLAGWAVEEPELPKQINTLDSFKTQKLIDSMCYKNVWYKCPWQQAELNQILGPYGIREERIN